MDCWFSSYIENIERQVDCYMMYLIIKLSLENLWRVFPKSASSDIESLSMSRDEWVFKA
jgi:hypothetical protein